MGAAVRRGPGDFARELDGITNAEAKQQLLKAFMFAQHERLPHAVLGLALNDDAPPVQSWALQYLKEVALQDFSSNFESAKQWLAARENSTLASAFADALNQAVNTLTSGNADQTVNQLLLLKGAGQLLDNFPDAVKASGSEQALGQPPTAEMRARRNWP